MKPCCYSRQSALVSHLYSGIQCNSCGVRFPPEQTLKYSQHLDWHFRQNRRDRDSTRTVMSRRYYYDVNDWVQFEEIEDLEERGQSTAWILQIKYRNLKINQYPYYWQSISIFAIDWLQISDSVLSITKWQNLPREFAFNQTNCKHLMFLLYENEKFFLIIKKIFNSKNIFLTLIKRYLIVVMSSKEGIKINIKKEHI